MASIKQNPPHIPVALPDFRNLGVQARILVLANLVAVVAALVRNDALRDWWQGVLQATSALQPVLLVLLLGLYLANPWLARVPYRAGAATILLLCGAVNAAMHMLWGISTDGTAPSLVRSELLALCLSGVLLIYFNLRSRALSPAITEARLQALQARIRPHFLFNSLNAVLSLIRSDPRRAETALEDMADLFRVLMADNRQLVPLSNELALCRQYLSLEKLRLGERLRLVWHTDNMPEDALIPPLVLQPLLENAVYHGIEPFQDGGEININLYHSRDQVHLVLTNPYRLDGEHHSGNKMALSNIRERLALHFDAEASLATKITGGQYQIHIILPYRRAPA